jgi:hypothetical protein
MSLDFVGKIGGKPAIGADGEQYAVLTIKAPHELASTFLAEVTDSDGLPHLQRGRRAGVDDGALDDHILVRQLFALDDQSHRTGPLDEMSLALRLDAPVLIRMFPSGDKSYQIGTLAGGRPSVAATDSTATCNPATNS